MKKKINDQLRLDLGRNIIIHERATEVDCLWCIYDPITKRSSNIPEVGKDWTTHSLYKGTLLICPNCSSRGTTQTDNTTTIKVIVDDVREFELVEGQLGKYDRGRKSIIGKLSDISGVTDFNVNILLKAIKIVFDGLDYRLVSVKPIGLLSDFSFEAILDRKDRIDLPSSGVLTS